MTWHGGPVTARLPFLMCPSFETFQRPTPPSHISTHAPPPDGPMSVLRHVLLLQRDVPAAARFYQEGLGLVVTVCTERWAGAYTRSLHGST